MSASETTSASAWDDLVYNMFYPSILGSVVFDYVDPLRFSLWNIDRLFLLPALLSFVVDYWHMKNDILANEGSKLGFRVLDKPGFRVLDVVITLFFLFSYYTFSYALTKEQATGSLPPDYAGLLARGFILSALALCLVLCYDVFRFGTLIRSRVMFSVIILSVVSVILCSVYGIITAEMTPIWFRFSTSTMWALYATYVWLWPKEVARMS